MQKKKKKNQIDRKIWKKKNMNKNKTKRARFSRMRKSYVISTNNSASFHRIKLIDVSFCGAWLTDFTTTQARISSNLSRKNDRDEENNHWSQYLYLALPDWLIAYQDFFFCGKLKRMWSLLVISFSRDHLFHNPCW